MTLPRGLSGDEFARTLKSLGYQVTRQTGSHFRLTTTQEGEHHVTIPRHDSLKIGTLASILKEVADHFAISREELIDRFFGER